MEISVAFIALFGFVAAETDPTADGSTYVNPVVKSNHPDPGILALPNSGGYVVVSSSNYANRTQNAFPIMFSADLINWKLKGHVFIGGDWPSWVLGDTWSPEIHFVNGKFHVYYSAMKVNLGLAISTDGPFGPYKDLTRPLMNETAIDSTWFRDPKTNKTFLLWKKQPDIPFIYNSHIQIQEIEEDGITFTPCTTPTTLLTSTFFWDLRNIGGPSIIYKDPYYYLFFSTSAFYLPTYNIGVARSTEILGPYTRWDKKVIASDSLNCLILNCKLVGPGHGSLVQLPNGAYWLAYHAWLGDKFLNKSPGRVLNIDKVKWNPDGWPYVGSPSSIPTPVPDVCDIQ